MTLAYPQRCLQTRIPRFFLHDLAVTFLFLVGAAISAVFSFPVGFLVAANGWWSTSKRTQHKALFRVFFSTTIISFTVVTLYFHWTIEQLNNI